VTRDPAAKGSAIDLDLLIILRRDRDIRFIDGLGEGDPSFLRLIGSENAEQIGLRLMRDHSADLAVGEGRRATRREANRCDRCDVKIL
jgi:hypothetical protein